MMFFKRLIPLAVIAAWSIASADAAVWKVTPADDVEDIVDNAEEGDTIIFTEGEYKLNLELMEPLTLKGEGRAVIDAGGKGSGITIFRSKTSIANLTIKNYGGDLYKRDSGVRVMDGCEGVRLTNLKLSGSGFGIRADRLENLEIRDCEISGNPRRHILDRGDGVFLNYVKRSKLINNSVRMCATGSISKIPMPRSRAVISLATRSTVSIGCTPEMTSAMTIRRLILLVDLH